MGGTVIVYMMRTVLEGQQTVFFIKGLWGLSVLATGPGRTVTAEYVHWSSTWRATETCSWLGPEQQLVPLKLQAEPPEMKLVMPGKAVDGLSHLGVLGGLNQADRQTGSETRATGKMSWVFPPWKLQECWRWRFVFPDGPVWHGRCVLGGLVRKRMRYVGITRFVFCFWDNSHSAAQVGLDWTHDPPASQPSKCWDSKCHHHSKWHMLK